MVGYLRDGSVVRIGAVFGTHLHTQTLTVK